MARVFVLAPIALNLRTAQPFGEIKYLYDSSGENRMPPVLSPTFPIDALRRMEDNAFDPDADFLLLAGQHVAIFQWVAAVVSEYEWCQGLIFDSTKSAYIARILGIQNLEPESMTHGRGRSKSLHVQP